MTDEQKARATFVRLLSLELDSIKDDELIVPQGAVEHGETVIGYASPDARKLYTFWMSLERAQLELKVQASQEMIQSIGGVSQDQAKENVDEIERKLQEYQYKARAYKELFWITLIDEHAAWGPESLGIRKDWQVVKFEPKGPDLPSFLKHFFGGGP